MHRCLTTAGTYGHAITVAPLRERKDDIQPFADHILRQIARRLNYPKIPLTRANLSDLKAYDWTGNVRELQNAIERAVMLGINPTTLIARMKRFGITRT